jgi:8-oxo-dGTP pyrophosphatase MutT (NUDIX family)
VEDPDDTNRCSEDPESGSPLPRRPLRPNEISAGGVVVRPSDAGHEVCLVSDGRYWGFPKGFIEPGETPEEAALREISEETGIPRGALTLGAPLPVSEYVYRRGDTGRLIFKRVHHFLVKVPAGTVLQPDPVEIAEAGWLGFDDARARLSFKNTVDILDAARRVLAGGGNEGAP